MSKRREIVPTTTDDLAPAEGDLAPYVCFTQLKDDAPFVYAGWLDAADPRMALYFAREHYGRDQACVNIWAIPRAAIAGTDPEYPASDAPRRADYVVFQQLAKTDKFASVAPISADSSAAALDAAVAAYGGEDVLRIWVVAEDDVVANTEDDLLWRLTDQTYRLARGYSKTVREKWEVVRAQPDLAAYEAEDLKETF